MGFLFKTPTTWAARHMKFNNNLITWLISMLSQKKRNIEKSIRKTKKKNQMKTKPAHAQKEN